MSRRIVPLAGADFYPTPIWVTQALLAYETFDGLIWECACGDGAMSKVMIQAGHEVYSSDLHDHGYGVPGLDFLTVRDADVDHIITNPPFNIAEGFVKTGLLLVRGKVCLLLRLAFLEGVHRWKTIYGVDPPARVRVFSERITMYPKGEREAGSGTMAFAWFVWDKQSTGETVLSWIQPGFKQRLTTHRAVSGPIKSAAGFF